MQRLRTRIYVLFSIAIAAIALPSCTSNNFEELADGGPCFQEEVLPIMVANCAQSGCHSSVDRQDGYDFSSYDGILRGVKKGRSSDSEIIEAMKDQEDIMPPPPLDPLPSDQIAIIAEWIDQGALNNSGCKSENCDSLSGVSYVADVKPIIDLHCKGCHNINNPSGGYEFENWEQTNGAATTDALMGVLNGDPAWIPMPWNAPPLSACKIQTIQVWVDEGAQNN